MKRQIHGFIYEQFIIEKYRLIKEPNYSSKYDAYLPNGIPVQIKCIKLKGEICLGDFNRNRTADKDFILHIGFWSVSNDNIVKEITLFIKHEIWTEMLYFDYIDSLNYEFNLQTNLKEDDNKWKIFTEKYKKLWGYDRLFGLRFKRDHKIQLRKQLAVPYKFIDKLQSIFRYKRI